MTNGLLQNLSRVSKRIDASHSITPILIAVFLLAFIARLALFFYLGAKLGGDTPDYFRLADNILEHHSYSLKDGPPFIPTVRRAPLYPVFIAALSIYGRSSSLIVILQIVLDSVVSAQIFYIASKLAAAKAALVFAMLYAVHPGPAAASISLLTETLFTFLLVQAVLLIFMGSARGGSKWIVSSGFVLGLAALCRPMALFYIVAIAIGILFLRQSSRRYMRIAALFGGFALALAPWSIRCSLVSNQFLLVQGASAGTWYIPTLCDWDQKNESTLWPRFVSQDSYGKLLVSAETPAQIMEADRYGFRQALRNISERPLCYAGSRLRSYPYLFSNSFDSFTGVYSSFNSLIAQQRIFGFLVKSSSLFILSLFPLIMGVIGAIRHRDRQLAVTCAAIWGATLIVHVPMWIEYRFWLPALPFLFVNAASGITRNNEGNPT